MSGNWCGCRAQAQRDGAPPRRKSLPHGRMRGEHDRPNGGLMPHCHHLPDMSQSTFPYRTPVQYR